jgi:hypothetical protein
MIEFGDPRLPPRFWAKCEITPNNCWEWSAAHNSWGYGVFSFEGRTVKSHVLSFRLLVGPIPQDKEVCHSCDNKPCCNPQHLFAGTSVANKQDAINKKLRIGNMKFSYQQVTEIRELLAQGVKRATIARLHEVDWSTIDDIHKHKTW